MKEYYTTTFPKSRVATFDVGKIGRRKHHITGFLEVDITKAKGLIKEKIKSGEEISFTSWVIKVIAKSISDNKYIQAINYKKRSQVVFNNVDISVPVEKIVNGERVPLALLIKEVDTKSISEIYTVIHSAKGKEISNSADFVLNSRKHNFLTTLFFNLPQFIRLIIWKIILISPFKIKENMGTVMVTNIGSLGNIPGWILPKSIHNLCFGIGSVSRKPWVINNKIEIRNILHLTVLFDHDAVDGSPAAIFTERLVRNMERAVELC